MDPVRALFLIENVSFTYDTRVQRQTHSLMQGGARVVIISPAASGEPFHAIEGGAHVYRYRKPEWGQGFIPHLAEYVVSLVMHTLLTLWVLLRHGFDVIHAANPPDLFWIVAAPYKLLHKRFIYDHHDLVPELFQVRFGKGIVLRLVLAMERMSFRLADHSIATNETFKRVAVQRGGMAPEDVTVVRNGPRLTVDYPEVPPNPEVRRLGRTIVGYLGIMNPQDHLDNFLNMAHVIRSVRGRTDVGFVMVGSGDSFDGLQALRDELGLRDAVLMTGSIPWEQVLATIGATHICVQPDPPTDFNRHLTMNKLMEYMAMRKPTVAYDMPETRVSGGDAVHYVRPDASVEDLADAVLTLVDDANRRTALATEARHRIETVLAWEHQSPHLLSVYERLFPGRLTVPQSAA